ncbi:transferase [Gautieria morchelliformis]|nr:transferase [Gautieria morchelliformis]
MASQTIVRVKPTTPPSGSRVSLTTLDSLLTIFIPFNLYFKPSYSGPTQLQTFVASLRDVLDRLPFLAGSVYDVEDAQGVNFKELVDDGRGADLIWVDLPIPFVISPDSHHVSPRTHQGDQECSDDQPLLMVKFTRFACDTLAMGISISHVLADFASTVNLIKEWARVCRGDSKSDPLVISSWDRHPGTFFPPPTTNTLPDDSCPTSVVTSPPHPRSVMTSCFLFTWESLRELKKVCTPTDPEDWVSTGDCVGAVVWRAITIARNKAVLKPGCDVHLNIVADARSRSGQIQPDALKYIGNFLTPFTVTLSSSCLLEGSLASVALACRRALNEQLTPINCANILASPNKAETFARDLYSPTESWISNLTKLLPVVDALDFGGGAPFWASVEQMPIGGVMIGPEEDGYLASFMIETEWENKLHTMDELLTYAKPVRSL